ncbi:MAG: HlyD family type I secretion periplasmic adaptor subunit [Pseudomonadota bacterium]
MSKRAILRQINKTEPVYPFVVAACVISLSVLLLVVWAAQTSMPAIVRAPGQLGPLNDLAKVDHFDGGVVQSLHVEPGQTVSAGQLIAVVEDPGLSDRRKTIVQDIDNLRVDRVRVEAVLRALEGGANAPDLTAWEGSGASSLAAYVQSQDVAYRARRGTLQSRLTQLTLQHGATRDVRDIIAERLDLAQERFAESEQSFNAGIISATLFDERRAAWQAAREDLLNTQLQLVEIESQQADISAEIDEAEAVWREDLKARLFAIETELLSLQAELDSIDNQKRRSRVVAPSDGVIQTVTAASPGLVVPPGGTIVDMLDASEKLVAIAKLNPRDIGHVSVGDAVRIRVTTFDFRDFGDVGGVITSIAPTSDIDENKVPHFKVVVTLDQNALGEGARRRMLGAGMEVSVEIPTDDRSLLAYFFKPAQRVLDKALAER